LIDDDCRTAGGVVGNVTATPLAAVGCVLCPTRGAVAGAGARAGEGRLARDDNRRSLDPRRLLRPSSTLRQDLCQAAQAPIWAGGDVLCDVSRRVRCCGWFARGAAVRRLGSRARFALAA